MEILDQEAKKKIISKISRYIDLVYYYDIHELTTEEFVTKYGGWGISLRNFFEVRFFPDTNGLVPLKKLLSQEEEYLILPVDGLRKIFRQKIDIIDTLFDDHTTAHLLVVDRTYKWVLIKNEYNKLIGMGAIKKKMRKKVQIVFDDERIMFCHTDSQKDLPSP